MSDTTQNSDTENKDGTTEGTTPPAGTPPVDTSQQTEEDKLKALIDEQLKPIKTKLDSAYSQRDEALRKIAEFEQKEREAELKRLEEDGKHQEAFELRLAEEKAKRETAEKRNVELTRDLELRTALNAHPFRNDAASKMAYQELVGQLVQNDQGVWLHKSGVAISDAVKTFAENADNSFLFRAKVNTGGGSDPVRPTTPQTGKKSLFEMTQAEVLEMAAKGTLPKRT